MPIVTFTREQLRHTSAEAIRRIEAAAVKHDAAEIVIDLDAYHAALTGVVPGTSRGPAAPPVQAVPRSQWPLLLRPVELLASHRDMGIGDTLHRCLERLGAGTLAEWYTKLTGSDCGCGDRQRKLNAMYPYEPDLCIDGTGCGNGDITLACWIAEGHRRDGRRVGIYAVDGYRDLVTLFGLPVLDKRAGHILKMGNGSRSYSDELRQQLRTPRAEQWQAELPWQSRPVRPAFMPSEQAVKDADAFLVHHNSEGRPLVVIYTATAHLTRRWPLSNYIDLAHRLRDAGCCVVALDGGGSTEIEPFPLWARGMGWHWQGALIRRAALVIGNDSAGVHLAGTIGTTALAMMGPTRTEVVFGHCLDSVRGIASDHPCTGCHFAAPYRAACDRGCQSLYMLTTDRVFDAAAERLGILPRNRFAQQYPPVPVAPMAGHAYTVQHEAEALAALLAEAQTVVEIGTAEGRCAAQMLAALPGIRQWIGIDVPPDHQSVLSQEQYSIPAEAGAMAKGHAAYTAMVRPGGSAGVRADELPQADAVFIDGDHSYEGVCRDTALADRCVKPGGVILWHDYGKPGLGVTRAIAERRAAGHCIHVIEGTCIAFEVVK
jgi:predicted O-methyltransferase YrrM